MRNTVSERGSGECYCFKDHTYKIYYASRLWIRVNSFFKVPEMPEFDSAETRIWAFRGLGTFEEKKLNKKIY